jgi:hypothetical protein
VPADLNEICDRMMAKKPETRFQSADEVRIELKLVLSDIDDNAPVTSLMDEEWKVESQQTLSPSQHEQIVTQDTVVPDTKVIPRTTEPSAASVMIADEATIGWAHERPDRSGDLSTLPNATCRGQPGVQRSTPLSEVSQAHPAMSQWIEPRFTNSPAHTMSSFGEAGPLLGDPSVRSDRCGHLAAFFGAATTRLGTALTVCGLVRCAFLGAGLANFGTHAAKLGRELRAAAHPCGGHPTRVGTVTVQANALRHLGDITFAEARVGTVLTGLGTADAGFDAALVVLLSHDERPFRSRGLWYVGRHLKPTSQQNPFRRGE